NTMLAESTTTQTEAAALLSIRALENRYSIQADTALVEAVNRLYPHLSFKHSASVTSLAASPDGGLVLTGDEAGMVWLWNVNSTTPLVMLRSTSGKVISVAFSPDGGTILAGDETGLIWGWETRTGNPLAQVKTGATKANSMTFLGARSLVLIGDADGTLRLWD